MASNYHYSSGAVSNEIIEFPRTICHLNIFVGSGVTFELSLDSGVNFIEIPPGFVSMPVGPVSNVMITSSGMFQLIGVQA